MLEIADWLQKLGLGQYAQRFAKNDITFAILPHLTDQDFKELGIASLGHRRQLLLAIAELGKVDKGTPMPLVPAPEPTALHKAETAERRHVTVVLGTGGLNRAVRAHGTIGWRVGFGLSGYHRNVG